MMIKYSYFLVVFVLSPFALIGQDATWQWPIPGQKAGEHILYAPEDFIKTEKNYGNIFVYASEGTPILAPKSGTIIGFKYWYNTSLKAINSFHFSPPDTKDLGEFDRQQRQKIALEEGFPEQYISLNFWLSCGNGEKYAISGLRPFTYFKTGQKIQQGDTIGYVGFAYKHIDEPCIKIDRSVNAKVADPMSPFGIRSTFVPFKYVPVKPELPVSELIADFNVFLQSLEEGHPGLYDYTSPANIDSTFIRIRRQINSPMSTRQFQQLLNPILDSLRDSHTFLYDASGKKKKNTNHELVYLPVRFGIQNDSAFIYKVVPDYKHLLGKQILKVNNLNIATLMQTNRYRRSDEGFTKGKDSWHKLVYFSLYYQFDSNHEKGDSVTFLFSDSSQVQLAYQAFSRNEIKTFIPKINKTKTKIDKNIELKILDKNTAYLRVKSFKLDMVTEDSLRSKMKAICLSQYQNLIIDVRDNTGGNSSFDLLFSMLANKPYRVYDKSPVNKKNI